MPGKILGAVGTAVGGPVGGMVGKAVGGMFGGKDKSRSASSSVAGRDIQGAENEALGYMDPAEINPELNQLTQDAIDRATNKAGAQLGVSQAQGGVTGGQAMGQQARQAGEIQQDLQYQDALQRRKELTDSRKSKAGYFGNKVNKLMGG